MSETIMSRACIARSADEAAAAWARNPQSPKPANPFNAQTQPDHFRVWACDFERQLLRYTAPADSEGGA